MTVGQGGCARRRDEGAKTGSASFNAVVHLLSVTRGLSRAARCRNTGEHPTRASAVPPITSGLER